MMRTKPSTPSSCQGATRLAHHRPSGNVVSRDTDRQQVVGLDELESHGQRHIQRGQQDLLGCRTGVGQHIGRLPHVVGRQAVIDGLQNQARSGDAGGGVDAGKDTLAGGVGERGRVTDELGGYTSSVVKVLNSAAES